MPMRFKNLQNLPVLPPFSFTQLSKRASILAVLKILSLSRWPCEQQTVRSGNTASGQSERSPDESSVWREWTRSSVVRMTARQRNDKRTKKKDVKSRPTGRVSFCEMSPAPWSPAPLQGLLLPFLLIVKCSREKGGLTVGRGRGVPAPSFHSNFLPPSPNRPSHSCQSVCGRVCHPTGERPQTVNADKINFLTLIPLEAGSELLEFCSPLAQPTGCACPRQPDCFQIVRNLTGAFGEIYLFFFIGNILLIIWKSLFCISVAGKWWLECMTDTLF